MSLPHPLRANPSLLFIYSPIADVAPQLLPDVPPQLPPLPFQNSRTSSRPSSWAPSVLREQIEQLQYEEIVIVPRIIISEDGVFDSDQELEITYQQEKECEHENDESRKMKHKGSQNQNEEFQHEYEPEPELQADAGSEPDSEPEQIFDKEQSPKTWKPLPGTNPIFGTVKPRKGARVSFAQPSCEVITFDVQSEAGSCLSHEAPPSQSTHNLSESSTSAGDQEEITSALDADSFASDAKLLEDKAELAEEKVKLGNEQVSPATSVRQLPWDEPWLDFTASLQTGYHEQYVKTPKTSRIRKLLRKLRIQHILARGRRFAARLRCCSPFVSARSSNLKRYSYTASLSRTNSLYGSSTSSSSTIDITRFSFIPPNSPPTTSLLSRRVSRVSRKLQKRPPPNRSISIPLRTYSASQRSAQTSGVLTSPGSSTSSTPRTRRCSYWRARDAPIQNVTQTHAPEGQFLPMISQASKSDRARSSFYSQLEFTTSTRSIGNSLSSSSLRISLSNGSDQMGARPASQHHQQHFMVPRKPLPSSYNPTIRRSRNVGTLQGVYRGVDRADDLVWLPGYALTRVQTWPVDGEGGFGWVNF